MKITLFAGLKAGLALFEANPMSWIIPIAIIGGLLIIFLLWWIATANNFRRTKVKVEEAGSSIDVALTKRYDVLTKALDVAKGYAKHEREVLTEVVNLRSGMTVSEKAEANAKLDGLAKNINVLAEAYPQLRSDSIFQQLQLSIRDVEEHLQASRRLYNANVATFNQMMVTFPQSIVGKAIGAAKLSFFEAEAFKREDVKMSF